MAGARSVGHAYQPVAPNPWTRRWVAAAGVLALALVVTWLLVGNEQRTTTETTGPTVPPAATTAPVTSTTAPPSTTITTTSTTTTVAPTTTPSTATEEPAPGTLRRGDQGPEVLVLQERLVALGYWLGTPDGVFGDATLHAFVALQKVAGLSRDGVVGPATEAALEGGVRPVPQSASGRVIEIDLTHQVLLVVVDGEVTHTFDTSTGRVPGTTPAGRWSIEREIDGYRRSPLGLLYRPKYFHQGVAVHGYTSVPAAPASHGCVRVTYAAMDAIWAAGLMPVGTPVWVY
jgi:peptidoglycan hydrolase-like protein with peptidoglycan-binding domain